MKLFRCLIVIGLLAGCFGSAFLTWFLYQMNKESAVSFQIGQETLKIAQEKTQLASDPEKGLAMTFESLEKLKSEQYNQHWLAQWDRKGQRLAKQLSQQGKTLVAMSDKGLKEAYAKKGQIKNSRVVSKKLLSLQKESLVLAKEMKMLSEKLLPISETLSKLIP